MPGQSQCARGDQSTPVGRARLAKNDPVRIVAVPELREPVPHPVVTVVRGGDSAQPKRVEVHISGKTGEHAVEVPGIERIHPSRTIASAVHSLGGDAAYSAAFNRLTYAELGRRAAREASSRGGALVDATFRHRPDRESFADAFADAAPLLFVECRAPARVLAQRAAQREIRPGRVSDASLSVVLRESSTWEPLDEVVPEAHVTLRTDRPVDAQLEDLCALLDRRIGLLSTREPRTPAVSEVPARLGDVTRPRYERPTR